MIGKNNCRKLSNKYISNQNIYQISTQYDVVEVYNQLPEDLLHVKAA